MLLVLFALYFYSKSILWIVHVNSNPRGCSDVFKVWFANIRSVGQEFELWLYDINFCVYLGNVGIGHRDLDIQTHTTYTVSQGKLPAHCGLRGTVHSCPLAHLQCIEVFMLMYSVDKHSPTRSYAILFAMSTSRYWYFW